MNWVIFKALCSRYNHQCKNSSQLDRLGNHLWFLFSLRRCELPVIKSSNQIQEVKINIKLYYTVGLNQGYSTNFKIKMNLNSPSLQVQ